MLYSLPALERDTPSHLAGHRVAALIPCYNEEFAVGRVIADAVLLCTGFALSVPVVVNFLQTGPVPPLPTALLATGVVLAAWLSFVGGLVLEQVAGGRQELKRLAYLSIPAVGNGG